MNSFAPIFDVQTVVQAGTALAAAKAAALQDASAQRHASVAPGRQTRQLPAAASSFAERVDMTSLSLYWVLIHRWGELKFGAAMRQSTWPFESTASQSFERFSAVWNMSAARYKAAV